jgi:ankyrin repeat protein
MTSPVVTIRWITAITLISCLVLAPPLNAQTIFDAARQGDASTVHRLLESDPSLVTATDEDRRTALHYAAQGGRYEAAAVLLDAGAEIDAREEDDETPLHYAAWRSQVSVGRLLIARGANLEARNHWGRTPLLIVGRETGNADMAGLLIDAGTDVNARDRGDDSSLDLAAWRGFADLVDLLLDNGAELPPPDSRGGQFVAMFAADKGLVRLFNLCVDAGVDLELRNESDGSLLHSASQGGSADVVARLLDAGFDPNEHDRYGRTPLHYASELGREEAAKVLLDRGADINARSRSGETAYNTAQWVERAEMAHFLAGAGADTAPRRFPNLRGPYLGQQPPAPDDSPTLFATDIVSTHRFQHGTIVFSPAGDEAFWSSQIATQETGYSQGLILFSRVENGKWTQPAAASFSHLGWGDDVPFYAQDGERLYFLSGRRAPGEEEGRGERIWYVDRAADGWSEPVIVDGGPNMIELHWEFSVAADGSIYVGSRGDLFVSRYANDRYTEPESLGGLVNSEAEESMPFIAPDGSYLLFTRFRHAENLGFSDVWVSFPDKNGVWQEPLNLGERINSQGGICPIVSPDGSYLFFNSGNDDNYWLGAGFIEQLRTQSEAGRP